MFHNHFRTSDFRNVNEAFSVSKTLDEKQVIFLKFITMEPGGTTSIPYLVYKRRTEFLRVEVISQYDIDKFGVRKQGDIYVYSPFEIRGNDDPTGTYQGDLILWRNKVWMVAEVVAPLEKGSSRLTVLYHTVMRQTNAFQVESFWYSSNPSGQAAARIV